MNVDRETHASTAPVISRSSERIRAILARRSSMMDERAEPKSGGNTSAKAPAEPAPIVDRNRSADLVDTVTNHIVPRLMLAHRMDARAQERVVDARKPPTTDEIAELAELAVAQDVRAGMALIDAKLSEGASLEWVLLDWLSAAARLLGEQWQTDDRSFADVTLGSAALHRMVALVRHRLRFPLAHRGLVVLTTAPREQHTLAIHVLADLLKHVGWDVMAEPSLAIEELVAVVKSEPVVMVGISVSSDDLLEPLERVVARVREASLNRDVAVMLGGAIDLSSHAESIGAVHCPSARVALAWLERRARISL